MNDRKILMPHQKQQQFFTHNQFDSSVVLPCVCAGWVGTEGTIVLTRRTFSLTCVCAHVSED